MGVYSMTNESEAAFELRICKEIESHGWFGLVVEEDDDGPGFEYTVGLPATFQHPEVILFGLPFDVSHKILWSVVRGIKAGRSFREDGLYEEIIERFACALKPVKDDQFPTYLGYALWHNRVSGWVDPFSCMQLFWPDKRGLFPWQEGCDPGAAQLQPNLSE
jgi:hypothetical protein